MLGLSPRVRGSRTPPFQGRDWSRSIPASAGQPMCRGSRVAVPEVYPRECGAAHNPQSYPHALPGLSPRVRGSQCFPPCGGNGYRSIPASAGQPIGGGKQGDRYEVYPRECGAAHSTISESAMIRGLSPRVRGSLDCPAKRLFLDRSIPASAGQPPR